MDKPIEIRQFIDLLENLLKGLLSSDEIRLDLNLTWIDEEHC